MIDLVQGEDFPRPGRRVKRWFHARLAVFLNQQTSAAARRVQDDPKLWVAVRDTYVDDIERYLYWKPADACPGGRGYSDGEHALDVATILQDLPEIVDECTEDLGLTPAVAASPPPKPAPAPIPDGSIDVDRALAALAAPESGVAEPQAYDLLRGEGPQGRMGPWSDACGRLSRARSRIRRKTPRPCRVCGVHFIGRQVHVVTCDPCKAAGRKRCPTCNEVFNTANAKAKRCTNCIEKDAAQKAEKAARRG